METRRVDLGNGLTAIIRGPAFGVWQTYERLLFRPGEAEKSREDKITEQYLATERGHDEAAAPAEKPASRRLVHTTDQERVVYSYVTSTLIPDCLVALEDGGEVRRCLDGDGEAAAPLNPYPLSLRDLGPHRCMILAHAITKAVEAAASYSFRPRLDPESSAATAGASEGERAIADGDIEAAGIGGARRARARRPGARGRPRGNRGTVSE